MKKILYILVVLVLVACGNEPTIHNYVGSYSYKTSGSVDIDGSSVKLSDEIGVMDIIRRTDTTLLLTFNQLQGSVMTADAALRDGDIYITNWDRSLHVGLQTFDVQITGQGEYLDGTIVFNLNYTGTADDETSLAGEDILLIAKKNE